jgi:hypothetical protein
MAFAPSASAQAPIREGLRATGQAAAGVAEGTARVVQGTGQAAAGVAQGAGQAAIGAGRAVAGGVRAGVDALTPGIPWQGRPGVNLGLADRAHNAPWRMQRHNGEWWYYGPNNNWMYHRDGQWNAFAADSFTAPQPYTTGYRGVDQSGQLAEGQQIDQGQQYDQGQQAGGQDIRTDAQGRQFICENGHPVYLDEQGQMSGEHGAAHSGTFQQNQGGQLHPTPAQPEQSVEGSAQAGVQAGATQPQPAQPPAQPQPQAQPQAQPQGQAPATGTAPATY